MFIADGYNRRAILTIGQQKIRMIYRPFLTAQSADRDRFLWEVEFLGADAAQAAIDQWLLRQIVGWDLDKTVQQMDSLRRHSERGYDHLKRLLHGVEPDASGERWRDIESQWSLNLREGVILDLTATKVARRSCADCQTFWYLENGTVAIRNSTGEKELRPDFALPACRTEFGCPKGTPENQKSLSTANGWAWRHFKRCDAAGIFPEDEIVKHNAGIIRKAMKDAERILSDQRTVNGKATVQGNTPRRGRVSV